MITLPSKKAQSFIVIIIGVVITTILVFGQNTIKKSTQSINSLIAGDKISLPKNPNWQEDLGNISITNSTLTLETLGEISSTSNETLTDTISRSLMSNYLVLKQNGNLDPVSAENLITQTVGYIEGVGTKKINTASLNIIPDNGEKSMIEYGDRVGNIIKTNKPKNAKNELKILQSAVENRDPNQIRELDQIVLVYKKIADDLQKIPVPKKFEKIHLSLVNSLYGMSYSIGEMSIVFDDPMRGLTGMQSYQESGSTFMTAIQALGLFLTQNNISYKQGSGGYYLLNGI